jgi:hypothetical protein
MQGPRGVEGETGGLSDMYNPYTTAGDLGLAGYECVIDQRIENAEPASLNETVLCVKKGGHPDIREVFQDASHRGDFLCRKLFHEQSKGLIFVCGADAKAVEENISRLQIINAEDLPDIETE